MIALGSTPTLVMHQIQVNTSYKVLKSNGTVVVGGGAIVNNGTISTVTLLASETDTPGPIFVWGIAAGGGLVPMPQANYDYVDSNPVGRACTLGVASSGMTPDGYTWHKADGTTGAGAGAIHSVALGSANLFSVDIPAGEMSVEGPFTVILTNLGVYVTQLDFDLGDNALAPVTLAAAQALYAPAKAGDAMTLTVGERNAIAAAFLTLVDGIEAGVTPKQALRAIAAVLAGKAATPAGHTTFDAIGNPGTIRVDGTTPGAGVRSAVALTL